MGHGEKAFMQEAIDLARRGVELHHGGPFGAVVVLDGRIIGRGWNQVVTDNDPTAHAEINAIREACGQQESMHLNGATLYASCEPCPMRLSAAYWAHIETIIYAADANDAAGIGFSDQFICQELQRPPEERKIQSRQLLREESLAVFQLWKNDQQHLDY
ncbi:MAG: nucleoside deaminase [gamma proteobacterium endosymbiont of Lamellibrachia anaximandri]|nr:nucleoside deaminase [gamma proteobacterium endosymbiont of Lamellibrachia anaximandri]MBL3532816.1 nucleoside deaminase [gamma proteobacterium endosymbiont of Lamellibrachia anaximandri]